MPTQYSAFAIIFRTLVRKGCDVFLNMLLKKAVYWWFEKPWYSRDVTIVGVLSNWLRKTYEHCSCLRSHTTDLWGIWLIKRWMFSVIRIIWKYPWVVLSRTIKYTPSDAKANRQWGGVGWMLADNRGGLLCSSFLLYPRLLSRLLIGYSICWRFGSRDLGSNPAEEDNMSFFDSKVACLCQSIGINTNNHICVY